MTLGMLAEELGVSGRTLSRDLGVLRQQGVPIDAERGKGGGVSIRASWGMGRISLSFTEAVDLMITLAIAEQLKSPLFMANLQNIRQKINSSFSPQMRIRVKNLKKRILIFPSASVDVLSSAGSIRPVVIESLHRTFLFQQPLGIHYQAQSGAVTERVIEPHYLLLSSPVWYVLAWDSLRRDTRMFRCDRVLDVFSPEQPDRKDNTAAEFSLLPKSRFDRILADVEVK